MMQTDSAARRSLLLKHSLASTKLSADQVVGLHGNAEREATRCSSASALALISKSCWSLMGQKNSSSRLADLSTEPTPSGGAILRRVTQNGATGR